MWQIEWDTAVYDTSVTFVVNMKYFYDAPVYLILVSHFNLHYSKIQHAISICYSIVALKEKCKSLYTNCNNHCGTVIQ